MSEFQKDIGKEVIPEVDKHGFTIKPPISDFECIQKCVQSCDQLCGLDRKQMLRLIKELGTGSVTHWNTYDQSGRQGKKIVIEYFKEEIDDDD